MNIGAWIWIGLFLIGLVLFLCYSRTGRLIRCILFTAATGAVSLAAVWLVGHLVPIQLAVTPLTIGISLLLGVPGVVGMLLLNLI